MTSTLDQASAILKAAEEATGWYCAGCHCGVDPVDVTFAEAHVACGRTITDDRPETDIAVPVALALIEKHRALEEAMELFRSICSAYENQDLNHVDFRVKCAEFARDFLARQGA